MAVVLWVAIPSGLVFSPPETPPCRRACHAIAPNGDESRANRFNRMTIPETRKDAKLFSGINRQFPVTSMLMSGSVNFSLPNLQGRSSMHPGTGSGISRSLGQSLGEENHTLLTTEMPAPTHGAAVLGTQGWR